MWGPTPEPLDQTRFTQPALFAVEVALYRQWEAWGVVPDILLGHSVGELVAAHVAGVLSLDDAALLVCSRGLLMDARATQGGAMVSIAASEADVLAAIERLPAIDRGQLDLAGVNAPHQTVVSGDRDAVEALTRNIEAQGHRTTRLVVSHAFHSAHMDPMLEALRSVAEGVRFSYLFTGDLAELFAA
jgi:acyl transferase domain-containing protein